jgi:hypothetical protein
MPFPSGTYINQIEDWAVRQELQQLYALFQGYLATEHKDSGAHAAVTADSLSTIGNVTADSDGRLPVVIGPLGTGVSPGGLGDAGLNIGGKWYVRAQASSSPGGGNDYELQFWDLTNDPTIPAMRLVYQTDGWRLMHGSTSSKTLKLGTSSKRLDEINVLTQNIITECNSTNGYKEFARSVASGVWQAYTPTWNGSTSNGTIGNGSLSGRYAISGNTVFYEVALTIGSTSTLAVGSWSFSLPVGKRNDAFVNIGASGSWFGGRSGVNFYMSHAFYDTAKAYPILANNPLGQVSNVSPIAWTTGDVLILGGSYEMA